MRTISVTICGSQPGPARHFRWTSCSCWWDWSSLIPGRGARFRKSIFSWQLQPKIWHWRYWTRCRECGGSAEINWTNTEADIRLQTVHKPLWPTADLLPRLLCLNSGTSVALFLGNSLKKWDYRGAMQQGTWTREGYCWLPPVYLGRAVLQRTTSWEWDKSKRLKLENNVTCLTAEQKDEHIASWTPALKNKLVSGT